MPKYRSKDKTVEVSGSGPNGEAIGPISFKTGVYTTTDENEAWVLDHLALDESSPVAFDEKEE
jgi:hypothetical protein